MKYLYVIFCFTCAMQGAFASSADTSKILDLTYHSAFEKANFKAFSASNQLDTLAFLLALDSTATEKEVLNARKNLNAFFQTIDAASGKKNKDLKKFVDFIYSSLQTRFFKKYQENVSFQHIFKDGTYNYLTATALYALVCEHYGIPYQMKEVPTHVYLVVDPKNLFIAIETTDPKAEYFIPNEAFKQSFVHRLLRTKMISNVEMETDDIPAIFDKYFYAHPNGQLTFQQLVSLMYTQLGLTFSGKKQSLQAVYTLEKAAYLYPCERLQLLLMFANTIHLDSEPFTDLASVQRFTRIFPYLEGSKYKEHILNIFEGLSEEVLIKKNQSAYYDQIFKTIDAAIEDSVTRSAVHFTYYNTKVHEAFLKEDVKNALNYTTKCYEIYPDNLNNRANLARTVLRMASLKPDNKSTFEFMDAQSQKYPFLFENDVFYNTIMQVMMGHVTMLCEADNYAGSQIYFERFEKSIAQKPIELGDSHVGAAYGAASSYCIRVLNDYQQGRDWLARGLKYEPNSSILQRKLNVLNENPIPTMNPPKTKTAPKVKKK